MFNQQLPGPSSSDGGVERLPKQDIVHPGEIHWLSLKTCLNILFCLIAVDIIRIISTKSVRNGLARISSSSFSQSFAALTGIRTHLFTDLKTSMSSPGNPVFISPRAPLFILCFIPTVMIILVGQSRLAPEHVIRNLIRVISLGSFSFLFDFMFSVVVLDCVASAILGLIMQSLILATALYALTYALTMLQAQQLWDNIWHNRRKLRLRNTRGASGMSLPIPQGQGQAGGNLSRRLVSEDVQSQRMPENLEAYPLLHPENSSETTVFQDVSQSSSHGHSHESLHGHSHGPDLSVLRPDTNQPNAVGNVLSSQPPQGLAWLSQLNTTNTSTQGNTTTRPNVLSSVPPSQPSQVSAPETLREVRLPGPEQGVPRLETLDTSNSTQKQTLEVLKLVAGALPIIGTQLGRKLNALTSGYRMD